MPLTLPPISPHLSRRGRWLSLVLLLLVPALAGPGCVSGGAGMGGSRTGPIERVDVEASSARNAYDLVQSLRPQWLRGRGPASLRNTQPALPVVYVDGVRFGPVESLRQITVESLQRLEFMSAPDATNRYGTGHGGGAILVQTRR